MAQYVFTFSEADVAAVLRRTPRLGCNGLAPFSPRNPTTPFAPAKAADPILIRLALFMARHTRFTTNIKERRATGSYGWKHVAERAMGEYVTNGEFILVALLLGHRIKSVDENNPNCFINMAVGSPELQDMVNGGGHGPLPCFAPLEAVPAPELRETQVRSGSSPRTPGSALYMDPVDILIGDLMGDGPVHP